MSHYQVHKGPASGSYPEQINMSLNWKQALKLRENYYSSVVMILKSVVFVMPLT
jgi:hypothetical protein